MEALFQKHSNSIKSFDLETISEPSNDTYIHQLANCKNLVELSLVNMNFSKNIHKIIDQLRNLTRLTIRYSFKEIYVDINNEIVTTNENLSLTKLHLSTFKLSAIGFISIGAFFPNIVELFLFNCQLEETILEKTLCLLDKLRKLIYSEFNCNKDKVKFEFAHRLQHTLLPKLEHLEIKLRIKNMNDIIIKVNILPSTVLLMS